MNLMEQLGNFSIPFRDLVVVGSEILFMVALLVAANLLISFVFRRLEARPAFQGKRAGMVTLRRNSRILLVLFWSASLIALLGYNGYLLYKNVDLMDHGNNWVRSLPEGFWLSLGINLGKVIGLAFVAALVSKYLGKLLIKLMDRAKAFEQIKANDESVEKFFTPLNKIQKITIWLLVLIISAKLLAVPPTLQVYLYKALTIYLIIALGTLLIRAIAAIVDSLDGLSRRYSRPDNFLRYYDQLRSLMPLLRRSLEYIIYVSMATLVVLQLEGIAWLATYGPRLAKVIGIFFLSRVVIEVFSLLINKGMAPADDATPGEEQQRLTFVPLIQSFARYLIYFLAFVLILKALEIDPTPILASAGLLGLVVGLGAQPLINDFVSGFFILFDNVYMVNDYIETGSARGTVESIDIRTTRIRGRDGEQHILRNGQIGEIINYSKKYTFAVVEVGVAYESDLDHVYKILREIGEDLEKENPDVMKPTDVLGLDDFGASDLTIRMVTEVKPGRHLGVARDLRKRIKETFDREGIEIPYARRVLIFKKEDAEQLVTHKE